MRIFSALFNPRATLDKAVFESGLDGAGQVPIICVPSGACRLLYGLVHTISTMAYTAFKALSHLFSCQWSELSYLSSFFRRQLKHGAIQMGQGICEMLFISVFRFLFCSTPSGYGR